MRYAVSMSVLDEVSEPARRVYQAMAQVSTAGICKANQRELVAMLNMAFKTLCPARDELVTRGLLERIHHKRGRRDWYKIVPETAVERAREKAKLNDRRAERSANAYAHATAQLPLITDSY